MNRRTQKLQTILPLILIALLAGIMLCYPATTVKQVQRQLGHPVVTTEYAAMETYSIDQIVETGDSICVLYGSHSSNVQVFDSHGGYRFSAYFATHTNGAFSLAASQDKLYVQDERRNVYVFENGEFRSFLTEAEAEQVIGAVDFTESSERYFVRLGSVWERDGDRETCVIRRPLISALYQNNLSFYLMIALIALYGAVRHIRNKNLPRGKAK